MATEWKPSRREQRTLWWLQLAMRFGVGAGGLGWELIVDKLRNPIALLVFGTLASSTDVFAFARTLIKQARDQRLEVEREVIKDELHAQHDE